VDSRQKPEEQFPVKPELDWVRAQMLATRAALRNRAFTDQNPSSATLTAPTIDVSHVFAVALLTAKVSGQFQVGASGTATIGAVEAGGVSVALLAVTCRTTGATITISGGTASNGQNTQISSGTSPITLAASTGSLAVETSAEEQGLNNLASSALNLPWSFSGIYGAGGGIAVTVGQQVAFAIVGAVSTTTLLLANFSLSAFELP
jgi:hypothetical protein